MKHKYLYLLLGAIVVAGMMLVACNSAQTGEAATATPSVPILQSDAQSNLAAPVSTSTPVVFSMTCKAKAGSTIDYFDSATGQNLAGTLSSPVTVSALKYSPVWGYLLFEKGAETFRINLDQAVCR